MSDPFLLDKLKTAVWAARTLFDRQQVTGSTSNISFMHGGDMYISAGNSCFGLLNESSFAVVREDGSIADGQRPSKEYPLHRALYARHKDVAAVIHTHSFYSTVWSTLDGLNEDDAIPAYTPYLGMKLGGIRLVPYAPPGSAELFGLFEQRIGDTNGYILKNHGPVVGAKSILDAFYCIEELEQSARIAWELAGCGLPARRIEGTR